MAPSPVDPKKRPRHQRSLSDKENTPQSTSNTKIPLQGSTQSSRRTTSSNHLQYPNETSTRRTNTNSSSAAVRRSPRIQARPPLLQANRISSSSVLGTQSLKKPGLNAPPSSTHATPRPSIRAPSARLPSSSNLGAQSLKHPPLSPFVPVPPTARASNAPLPSISALGTQSLRRQNNSASPAFASTTPSHLPLTPNSSFSSSARPAPPAGMSSFAFRFEATRRAALERESLGGAGEAAGMGPAPERLRESLDVNDSWLWEGKEEEEGTGKNGEKKRRG